jgi:superfamily II DNA/RNA helicase
VGSDSPSSSGPWNDLWDVDDGATGKSRQSDVEKQAIGQARQKRRQSDVEEGRPLTIDAVAQRFRQRQTSPHGKSRRTLFVATDDPIPSFDALVQQGLPGPDASDAEFRALLLRNVLRELSNRAVESGTVAVELTTGALEVDGTDDAELERLVQLFRPTRVQAESCEAIASGQDVLIAAPTGCGKTLAFLLPLLLRLHKTSKDQSGVKIVVVAPSRELAMQISNVCSRLLETSSFRCLALIGGANINRQLDNIKERKPQIVVGTPGRLAEIAMARGRLKLGGAMAMVVDECDSMLSEPHRKDLELLLQQVSPTSTQVVVASATGGDDDTARQITQLMGGRPFKVLGSFPEPSTGGRPALNMSPLPETVEHGVMIMPQHKMIASIKSILNSEPHPEAAIVFVNEGRRVDIVCQKLLEMNVIAAPLHGESSKADRTEVRPGHPQPQHPWWRTCLDFFFSFMVAAFLNHTPVEIALAWQIMQRLATGRLGLVVTTELASRGLDLPILSHVINLDLPTDATHYAHRAGRVGRAGRAGIVISFAIPATSFVLTKFSRQLNVEIPRVDVFGGILAVTAVSSGTAEGETEQLSAGLLSAGVQQPRKRPRSASLIPSALP